MDETVHSPVEDETNVQLAVLAFVRAKRSEGWLRQGMNETIHSLVGDEDEVSSQAGGAMANLLPSIEKRRARRALSDRPIDRETAETLLWAAHLAPSCFNNQPWRLIAVEDPDTLSAIKGSMPGANYWTGPSPLIVAVASRRDLDCALSDERDYFLFGCGMAIGNLMLQATEMGLIAHPIAGFNPTRAKEILGIPEDHTLITLVIVGHPAEDMSGLSDKHREIEVGPRDRKPLEEVVAWNHFAFSDPAPS